MFAWGRSTCSDYRPMHLRCLYLLAPARFFSSLIYSHSHSLWIARIRSLRFLYSLSLRPLIRSPFLHLYTSTTRARLQHDEVPYRFVRLSRCCCRHQRLGESVVPRVELLDVHSYPISSVPLMLTYDSSYPETETMTTYTTVTTCPLTISSGSAYHTTLTTSTIVVTSCKGGCHETAAPPPPPLPKKTSSIGTAPSPPPSLTPPPPKPSKGTSVVVSSVPPPPETPIYSNVCTFLET